MTRIYIGDLTFQLSGLNNARREIVEGNRRPGEHNAIRRGLRRAANIYLKYLKQRYLALANSPREPEWPPISDKWKRRKTRAGWSNRTLIMGGDLLRAMRVEENKQLGGFNVGYTEATEGQSHPRFKGSIKQLADLLQIDGIRGGKRWQIIVGPDRTTWKQMQDNIQRGVDVMIRKANKDAERRARRSGRK